MKCSVSRNNRPSADHRIPALFLALAVTLICSTALNANETTKKPNVVFILFDDLGYGEPTAFRAESEFKMPNLDKLAREGMRFTDAHTPSAVCTPTRYGLLTGRYPMRIGQYGVLKTYSPPIIDKDRLTVGRFLQQNGYHTAAIGKWHLGMNWPGAVKAKETVNPPLGSVATDGPTTRGFDYFCGYTHSGNIGMVVEQDKVSAQLEPSRVQPYLAEKAIRYIDERANKAEPFFLYLPICTPHLPIVPAEDFLGKSDAKEYVDWLYQGDWVVGQVLDALERNRLFSDTLVIVTSDNGAAKRIYQPLRNCKTSIYEGGHRVPFFARWPGNIKAGAVCNETICLTDLLATCADLLDVKLPPNAAEDSFSILPALKGVSKAPIREATIHQSLAGDLAIRQGPWKLIFLKNGDQELYNLKEDLSESQDMANEHPQVVEALAQLMQKYIANGRSTPGDIQKNAVEIRLGKAAKKSRR
jgi:arylsulfatase A-like enzyme